MDLKLINCLLLFFVSFYLSDSLGAGAGTVKTDSLRQNSFAQIHLCIGKGLQNGAGWSIMRKASEPRGEFIWKKGERICTQI